MRIVLLDHSGSMGEPFEAPDAGSRRTRTVDAETKLQAAREVLREDLQELRELDPAMRVVIFGFTSTVTLLYEGTLEDIHSIERALGTLVASSGTDIAAALNAAANYRKRLPDSALAQLLLISDGKSDRVQAMAAARRCMALQLGLSMMLIDPTEEGKAFARDVVRGVGGTYQPIASRQDLRDAARETTASYGHDLARATKYLEAAARESESVRAEVADREQVRFTAGYPGRIQPGLDYPLRVYVHLDSDVREVESRLEEMAREFAVWRRGEAESNQRIPIGTGLEITPRIAFVQVSPPQQRIAWTGILEELAFRMHYAGPEANPAPPCSGFIDVTSGGLLLAQIPVSLPVAPGQARLERRTAEMISRVFASYSHRDERIVRACKEAYRALGIQLFVDKDDILAGQRWRNVLRQSIGDHDLFQLFWSQDAADSDEVANEWKLAKEIAQARTTGFIRPLFWTEPMPQPPQDLQDLHFVQLDLASLRIAGTAPGPSGAAPGAPPASTKVRLEASFPLLSTVDSGARWLPWLQERMGEVIPFLEDLLGVRYFPPATFLVDEHVVTAAREVLTTDTPGGPDAPGDADDLDPVLEILQALALGFHVGRLAGSDIRWDERAAFFDADSPGARADFEHVVFMSEYIFTGPVRQHLSGKDALTGARRSLKELLQEIANDGGGYRARDLVKATLERATSAERAAVETAATAATLEALGSFDKSRRKGAAVRLLDSELPRLAEQYGVFELFRDSSPHSLQHHVTFHEYVADFIRHWLGYTRTAGAKRPGAIVDVGYSIPVTALEWLRHAHPDVSIAVARSSQGWSDQVPEVEIEMPIDSYERCVERLSNRLLQALSGPLPKPLTRLVNVAVATHGIYIPRHASTAQTRFARFMADQRWPAGAALPGQHKVLLCVSAIDRFAEGLVQAGLPRDEADEMARRFSVSVLVHEHFHAAVATGLDAGGRGALGADHPDRWVRGSALNEALAVWCERHFFRGDDRMLKLIDDYISDGEYPAWPYRGGETVESFHAAGGTPAVRAWMRFLRDDPENAQQKFDERISSRRTP